MSDATAVDTDAIAEVLQFTPNTVRALARAGDIPAFKAGGRWRYFPEKVIAHLEAPKTAVDLWERPARASRRRAIG